MQQPRVLAERYRLLERIGVGGAAEVYRGEDLRLGREVAVKLLHAQLVADPEQVARFENEARSAATLTHPNVVDVYDYGRADGTAYIVMQYIDGLNLKDYIRERDRLHPVEAVRIALSVTRALDAAHARSLIHRDVKPQNIMIDRQGQVRITDFGIAKALSGPSLTQHGMTYGTAAYLSPEQASGGTAGPSSDVYSLGLVLYEMLSGQPAFAGDHAAAVAYKQVYEEPTPLHRLVPDVPPQLEQIVARATVKNPAARYPSAGAMAADLTNYLTYAPTPTPPHSIAVPSPLGGTAAAAAPAPGYGPPPLPGAAATAMAGSAAPVAPANHRPTAAYASAGTLPAPARQRSFLVPALLLAALALVALVFLGSRLLGAGTANGDLPDGPGTPGLPAIVPTNTSPPAPTSTLAAVGQDDTPTAPMVAPSATAVPAAATSTPAPPTPVPATNTPEPPVPTDTPEPPVPTDTPEPPAPTDTPEPPPPTDTPEPPPRPTSTPVPPTQAPAAPTATAAPPPATPTRAAGGGGGRGRPVFPTPTVPTGTNLRVLLEDVAFSGGWRYAPPSVYPLNSPNGRTAVWIYGAGTEFNRMSAPFNVEGTPSGVGTLLVSGLDSEGGAKTPMRILINGEAIFEGPNPLPDFPNWGTRTFTFPANLLGPGENTLTFANLDPSATIGRPPFVMVDFVEIAWESEE